MTHIKTTYVPYNEVNGVQSTIVRFCMHWVRQEKTPVPRSEIIKYMQKAHGVTMTTTRAALYVLIKKGYIREALTISNKTSYVQLRTL